MKVSSGPAPMLAPAPRKGPVNLCPNCRAQAPVEAMHCPGCGTTMRVNTKGAIAFWTIGDMDIQDVNALAKSVEIALGVPVILQPAHMDPKPSRRPKWQGRSGRVILDQLLDRDTPGTLTNVAVIGENIVSDAANHGVCGYAWVGSKSACLTWSALTRDQPDRQTLLLRARSVCLHEIGHNLELPDHLLSEGIACAMVGEMTPEQYGDPAAWPAEFCPACHATASRRLREFGEAMDRTLRPAEGKTFCQRYHLLEPAGEGGMGLVWKAQDMMMNQEVALKFVSSHQFDGGSQVFLQREAARMRGLSHPHIIRVFDLARDGGVGALVMDWVPGKDLASVQCARPGGFFDPDEIAAWTCQLAGALTYVHSRGVVHQDVKPGNCLINDAGELILTDFGIARPDPVTRGETRVFHTGSRGTAGFSAPEQFAGAAPDKVQDIHALGATLYSLLTGIDPGRAALAAGGRPPRVNALRPQGRSVDAAWENTIMQCLHPDPAARPPSANAVLALLGLSHGAPAPAKPGFLARARAGFGRLFGGG